jgi:hypothetical protein
MDLKSEILAHLDVRALYHKELGELKNGRGDQALGLCPFHEDTRASLSLNLKSGLWNCKACSAKGDVFTFIKKKYGTDFKGALSILAQEAGIEIGQGNARRRGNKASRTAAQIVKTYDYYDADGVPVFQVCRTHPKGFFQRRRDGNGGWVNNLDGVVLVPYRLPEVLKAEMVLILEGEKDCDTLAELGLTCTCNPQGAGKWRAEYKSTLTISRSSSFPTTTARGESTSRTWPGTFIASRRASRWWNSRTCPRKVMSGTGSSGVEPKRSCWPWQIPRLSGLHRQSRSRL